MEPPTGEESVQEQVAGIVRAAVESVARKPHDDERPTITEKEVAWAEAVAAANARKAFCEQEAATPAATLLEIMALPRCPKQSVGGLELEVYNLAINTVLEQLEHPFVVGGNLTNEDIAVAVIVFAQREFMEALIELYGAAKANAMLRKSADVKAMLIYLTAPIMAQINPWFRRQFGLAMEANGESASPEDAGKK